MGVVCYSCISLLSLRLPSNKHIYLVYRDLPVHKHNVRTLPRCCTLTGLLPCALPVNVVFIVLYVCTIFRSLSSTALVCDLMRQLHCLKGILVTILMGSAEQQKCLFKLNFIKKSKEKFDIASRDLLRRTGMGTRQRRTCRDLARRSEVTEW